VHVFVVRDLLELTLDDLVELVLDRNTQSELQRAAGVLATSDPLRRTVQFDLDELALMLFALGRVGRSRCALHCRHLLAVTFDQFPNRNELRFRN
jgi:hypothetical protein